MTRYKESISAVFPAFNEEANVGQAIEQTARLLPELTDDWEIIVVNDGSQDRTAEVLEKYKGIYHNLYTIHHRYNMGYGAALRSGIITAKKDLIFFCDSDLQFDIKELGELLRWIDEYDIVIGYREKRVDPLHRRLNAFGWNILVRTLLGLDVRDIDCAFKVFKRKVFDKVRIDAVGAMVNTDILGQAVKIGFKLKEVPVTHHPRINGQQSGANIRVVLKAFRELIKLYDKLREKRKHRRIDVPIKFRVGDQPNGWVEEMINLGEGGMRFKTHRSCNLKDAIQVELLHNDMGPINVSARVVRLADTGKGQEVAVKFSGIDRHDKRGLKNLLLVRPRSGKTALLNKELK